MTTTEIITQTKALHDAIQAVESQTQHAGQNGAYAHSARASLATAINQMMLHQYWIEQNAPPNAPAVSGTATVPLAPVASAKDVVAPTGVPPATIASATVATVVPAPSLAPLPPVKSS
jgi:hypothetical protein